MSILTEWEPDILFDGLDTACYISNGKRYKKLHDALSEEIGIQIPATDKVYDYHRREKIYKDAKTCFTIIGLHELSAIIYYHDYIDAIINATEHEEEIIDRINALKVSEKLLK